MSARRERSRKRTQRPRRNPAARERAFEVLNRMRTEELSLKHATRLVHTTPKTVRKYAGRALVKRENGRYRATASDRLTRRVWFFTKSGKVEISVRGSRQASLVARHMAAVDRYLRTGDTDALEEFRGKGIRSGNKTYPFLTDTRVLNRLAHAGEVSFERLYVLRE